MTKEILLTILISPLIGFILNGIIYPKVSKILVSIIANTSILISFSLCVWLASFFSFNEASRFQYSYFQFLSFNNIKVSFDLVLDNLNILYLLVITGVGFLIHLFSVGYMYEDEKIGKYFSYLNLFVFSMLLLVLGGNYLILFIGWEGVGYVLFLLIGFWNANRAYTYAARKAFIMNRIGDLCFLIAMFILFTNFKTLDFFEIQKIFTNKNPLSTVSLTAVTMLIFLGCTGKSAQIPLFTWLPDAMAGPTPVSALIHAATMVTAGIFLLSKSFFLFDNSIITQKIIIVIGLSTAFISGTIACAQNDIKKVLAYSTVSQLGFMFLSIGVGNYEGAIFHVITHAFFKALLFLGAGSIIHALHGEQDINKMGGLQKYLPITHITFLIACLSIVGIPGLSGFFSKDNILMAIFQYSTAIYVFALFVALITVFYMFRLYYLVFHGKFRGTEETKSKIHEGTFTLTLPLIILAVLSVFGGYINVPHLFGGDSKLSIFLSKVVSTKEIKLSHLNEILLITITLFLTLMIIVYTRKKYTLKTKNITKSKSFLNTFFSNKWYIDEAYNFLFVKPIDLLGSFLKSVFEKNIIDNIVNTCGSLVFISSNKIRKLQSGKIGAYLFFMLLGMIILFSLLIL